MNERDAGYLYDMLRGARKIGRFLEGRARSDLDADEMFQDALVRAITVLGEAAGQVSDEIRDRHPEIPWRDITGMRHRLVHDYRDVDLDRVWTTATENVPELVPMLEAIVPDPGENLQTEAEDDA